MSTIPPVQSKTVGILILCITLLVIARELMQSIYLDNLQTVVVSLLVLLLSFYVSGTRLAFVVMAVLLSMANLLWNDDWQSTLNKGFGTAAFIAAFFSALGTLKYAAETSPSILNCGRFLSQQPPGRRYVALTIGGQLFGLLLNYGAISLLGSMSVANAALEKNIEIRSHRIRRMLLAIQRGFISILPWSPFSFAIAIPTALIPGTSWAQCALPGLVNGAILAGTGWLLDSWFKPRLSSPLPARRKTDGNWLAVLPLLLLLMLLIALLAGGYMLSGLRVLILVMIIVPLLSLAWIMIQTRTQRRLVATRQRTANYFFQELAGFRGEMLLLMMAGYLGSVASPLLGTLMQLMHIDLALLPAWSILLLIVWFIPIVGQLGMNPILAAALIAPLLPEATALGISPVAIVVAITAGWILSGVSSPFTATTLLVGNFAGISSADVGRQWNGIFTVVCGMILSVWVVVYANLF